MKFPNSLSFARSIDTSEGLLFGIDADGKRIPAPVVRIGIRGTISNYDKELVSGEGVSKHNTDSANLQRVDIATLPEGTDTLAVDYNIIVSANAVTPVNCNDAEVRKALGDFVSAYSAAGGFEELGARHAWNIANARGLWRNAKAFGKTVEVSTLHVANPVSFTFDAEALDIDAYPGTANLPEDVRKLGTLIGEALKDKRKRLFLSVVIKGKLAPGQMLHPSEEFLSEKQEKGEGRVLSKRTVRHEGRMIEQATLHPQKLGVALRFFDDWHGLTDTYGLIPVDAYGYALAFGTSIRLGKQSFYKIAEGIEKLTEALVKTPNEIPGNAHYVAAMLVKGGVFTQGSKKED